MNQKIKDQLLEIFNVINTAAAVENKFRKENGSVVLQKCKIRLLGQTSLLAQPDLTYNLNLIQEALLKNMSINLARRIVENGGNLSEFK